MKNNPSYLLFAAVAALFSACQSDAPPAPVDVRMETIDYQRCLRDSLCVEVHIAYPVVSSSDAALAQRLTDSLQAIVAAVVDVGEAMDASEGTSFKQQMESLGPNLLKNLEADFGQDSSVKFMTYSVEAESKVLLNAPRYLSAQVSGYTFMGGAHGMGLTLLYTLHKATGRTVELTEVVADTAALRPLIEEGFLKANRAKGLEESEVSFENLLLDPEEPLPFPTNFCIVPEGIRMVYNPYEVTAYVYGDTDFVITWEQLGRLADRDKWLR